MPRYDFKCTTCQAVFEKNVKHTITFLPCPECNTNETTYNVAERQLCYPAVIAIH